ncbi:MAG: hypothetical protein KF781_04525 [Chitinophagaceae bacterium]|nr:hypothetical protein [Chitinophagaceae bacterium]MCW5904651.1 hypothetical protein [Chitinophagaceae bacterium]
MKKILCTCTTLVLFFVANAQRENEEEKGLGFRKDNIFIGGSISLGFGTSSGYGGGNTFIIGANPEVGYTLAEWIDAGIVFNTIYSSMRFSQGVYRYRQTALNLGAGAFVRIYPIANFFIQAQPEFNSIKYTQKNLDLSGAPVISQKVKASSFLVGVGYGQRVVGNFNFFTVLMMDLGKEYYSPYRNSYNEAIPIIRSGFNWYLHSSKKKK